MNSDSHALLFSNTKLSTSETEVNATREKFVDKYYEGDYLRDMNEYYGKEVRVSDPVPLKSLQGHERAVRAWGTVYR
ncbi:hypothetical protein DPMN_081399 [Dreissena polymorpha]|uniref:Uncharacterized protein n=1 Tax=Dreissena polymorpha TaxID=45954 RepID=A0A9D3Y8U6_DREPO|nr:hypothetical protein DPMN_081399 [Dreissena polymorpha]